MKQGLSLRVSQHLALTPQLQQSIRLLQMSTLELEQEVGQMLDDNPFLERVSDDAEAEGLPASDTPAEADADAAGAPSAAEPQADRLSDDHFSIAEPDHSALASEEKSSEIDVPERWEADEGASDGADPDDWGADTQARAGNAPEDDDEAQAGELARTPLSLHEHLHTQALALRLDAVDAGALSFLIDSLDDDGYVEEPLESLAAALAGHDDIERFDEVVHRLTVALRLLQSLDPAGVGARDLAECLRLQLQDRLRQHPRDVTARVALDVVAQPLGLLAKRDFKRLMAATGHTEAELRAAAALIARLEPKPGRRFADAERNVIIPDVIVTASGEGAQQSFSVQLNPAVMPRLRVQDVYARALRQHKGEGSAALQQRLQEARWFIKNIQQRFDTILRVSRAIVERQKSFFVHGELAMRPLVLREIADELGLHESTVSRVTTAKYMATPRGTFELKYFFGSGLETDAGGSASSTAVRALIRQFIDAEDPAHPLSDGQIADMLKEQGIGCARRTVAKYREAMRIAPANLRKAP